MINPRRSVRKNHIKTSCRLHILNSNHSGAENGQCNEDVIQESMNLVRRRFNQDRSLRPEANPRGVCYGEKLKPTAAEPRWMRKGEALA